MRILFGIGVRVMLSMDRHPFTRFHASAYPNDETEHPRDAWSVRECSMCETAMQIDRGDQVGDLSDGESDSNRCDDANHPLNVASLAYRPVGRPVG